MGPERGTLAVVRRLQEVDRNYGLRPQRQADAEALLAASTTILMESDAVSVPRWTPPVDGKSVLLVPPGLPYAPLRYAFNLVGATHRLRNQDPRVAYIAALVGILNVEDTQRKGEPFIRRKRAALEAVPGLFREYHVGALFQVALEVRDYLALYPTKQDARPKDAAQHLEAGRRARQLRQYARSIRHFQRSYQLAMDQRNWEVATGAMLNTGIAFRSLGNLGRAEGLLACAAGLASAHGLDELHGLANHELGAVAFGRGDFERAEELAVRAFWLYPRGCPRRIALLHDIAFTWMERGYCQRALGVFLALQRFEFTAQREAALIANIARAASGAGRLDLYAEFWPRAEAAVSAISEYREQGGALLDLAIAHCGAGAYGRASAAASRALEAAREAGEELEAQEAETWLLVAREQRAVEWLSPPPLPSMDDFAEAAVGALAEIGVAA